MISVIHRVMAPLARQVAGLMTRAVVHRVNDATPTQSVQLTALAGETLDGVEHFQPAGFKSVPLAGAEALVAAIGGAAGHRVAVVVHDKTSRPDNWQPGDVGLYHLVTGDMIWLRANGAIEIHASKKLRITAPDLELVGNLKVSGSIADRHGSLDAVRAAYNSHAHGNTPPPMPQMEV